MMEAPPSPPDAPNTGRWLWVVTSGLLAFVASWAVGVGITILIMRAIPPEVPHATEAYEGFGDFVTAVVRFFIGVGVSFQVAIIVGILVSTRVAYRRISRGQK